jgi:transcriptional regulator NrdR family protein
MTKAELQDKVNELELTLNSLELNAKVVKDDLKIVESQLEAVNKPIITKDTVNDIRNAIEEVFRQSSFNDVNSYDVGFEIDYNNSLALESIEFNDADNVEEALSDAIEYLFNIIDDEDEN